MSLTNAIRGVYLVAVFNFFLAGFTYLVIIVTKQFGLSYIDWSWYHWWLYIGVLGFIVGIFCYLAPYWEAKINIKLQNKLKNLKVIKEKEEVKP